MLDPKPWKEENISSKISHIACSNSLSDISPKARETRKNKQIRLHQTKKFLHSKGKHQQNKKVPNEPGEHTHWYIW